MASLFHNTESCCRQLKFAHNLVASKAFIDCADDQLTAIFIKETGIPPGKNVSIALTSGRFEQPLYSEFISAGSDTVRRRLSVCIYVNHNWNPVTIYWASKTGKDYRLESEDIDAEDIEFWFEGLDAELYQKQLYPGQQLPFKTSDLGFEIDVERLNMDATLTLYLKDNAMHEQDTIILAIEDFIHKFNEKSEEKARKDGVVHNWQVQKGDRKIIYEIDLGSTGPLFYQRLLKMLSQLDSLKKLTIG